MHFTQSNRLRKENMYLSVWGGLYSQIGNTSENILAQIILVCFCK